MSFNNINPASTDTSDQEFPTNDKKCPASNKQSINQVREETELKEMSQTKSDPGNLTLDDVEAVEIKIRGLSISVNTDPSWRYLRTFAGLVTRKRDMQSHVRQILHSVSANIQSGTLTAILGGSDSGKTTFLNAMSERVKSSRLHQEGVIVFNGDEGVHSIRYAYVMQQDILLPSLTVRETLEYSAGLRLPSSTSATQRHKVVEGIIRELGLAGCADTRVGNSSHGGCSGGEKRRLSVGIQLLANPSVLFLDEPTTGLDATSAFHLMQTLSHLARRGRTVIVTVHQPRSEIWGLLDNTILLSKGHLVYAGPATDCVTWFEKQGFPLPPFVNPAEHVIDVATVDTRTPEREFQSRTRVESLKTAWQTECAVRFIQLDKTKPTHRKPIYANKTSFFRQTSVLTHRTFKTTYRDPLGMMALITEAVVLGTVTGYLFFDLGRDLAGIRSRQGALYFPASLQGYLVLIFEVYRLTIEIPTFDLEQSEGCVDVIPYILSRRIARILTEDIPVPLIFSILIYFLSGFDRNFTQFFIFFAVTLVNHYVAVTCAMVCIATVRHFAGASLMANLIFTLQSLASGMIIQIDTMPIYIRWTKWITYTFYTFGAYCGNEFQHSFYDCPHSGGRSNATCRPYSGDFVMKSLGLPQNWVSRPILILVAFVVFFCVLSALGLHFFKAEMTISRSATPKPDTAVDKEQITAPAARRLHTIDIKLASFSLKLHKSSVLRRTSQKVILEPVDASFQAGNLNVIMGPSGSGKTSLLKAIALRLQDSTRSKYHREGKLLFNDTTTSRSIIRSVCSFVYQNDDTLLPSLTVRETLRFAALLRLPVFMSRNEKYRRSEEILMKMGLKDCADNLVGSNTIKGISGGEKRRVSIAIQILTDPCILLLDEPTSGLDAFTANSIMEVLRKLANEGRTIILTIHQPRSDLFKHFGSLVLLSHGGSLVYAGPAKDMQSYFSQLGYKCPQNTNPADFALDLMTIGLQSLGDNTGDRERVNKLIKIWKDNRQQQIEGSDHGSQELPTREEPIGDDSGIGRLPEDVENRVPQSEHLHGNSILNNITNGRQSSRAPPKRFAKQSLETPAELGALVRSRAPFHRALPILLHRAMINSYRQPEIILARSMQGIGLSIMFALFFAPLHDDYFAVQTRMGFVLQTGGFYFVGVLQNVAVYPTERDLFYEEDEDGVYSVDVFLAAYTILELPFELLGAFIYATLSIFAIGLPQTASMYFACFFCCLSLVSCGESLGIMLNTLFRHTGFAVNVMGVILSVAFGMAGVLSIDMPKLFKVFNYISPVRYSTHALAAYSLPGMVFSCTDSQELSNGTCPIETGEQVLKLYKLEGDPILHLGALAGCMVAYRVLAWVVLRISRSNWGDKRSQ